MPNNPAHERIHHEVTQNDVVLFMKGTSQFPQCGFSSTSVQILEYLQVSFKTINVLTDDTMRDSIKQYSSWPTIPQLYVKGEFIGGCDIMKEMFEANELQELLRQKGIHYAHKTDG